MVPMKEDSRTLNIIGVNEKEEILKSGLGAEHFSASMMKDVL